MFGQIITIYHKCADETWARDICGGVYYEETHGESIHKAATGISHKLRVIIPTAGRINLCVDPGDFIVPGESYIEIKRSARELERAYRVLTAHRLAFDTPMASMEVYAT